MMPNLYIVATPIGNLEDITIRAVRILSEVGLIAAEDTRITRRILQRYDINVPITSYHQHNQLSKLPVLLKTLKERDIALVSDAGMPGISDPGCELVQAAAKEGNNVITIPGPSAVTSAIGVSGIKSDRFLFLGFLPRRPKHRKKLLESLAHEEYSLVIFEAPHRILGTLVALENLLGERLISVCRELTKIHEEIFRGKISEALSHFVHPRGEFTLVIEGANKTNPKAALNTDVAAMILQLKEDGYSAKDSIVEIAKVANIPRREAYRHWLNASRRDIPSAEQD